VERLTADQPRGFQPRERARRTGLEVSVVVVLGEIGGDQLNTGKVTQKISVGGKEADTESGRGLFEESAGLGVLHVADPSCAPFQAVRIP